MCVKLSNYTSHDAPFVTVWLYVLALFGTDHSNTEDGSSYNFCPS
jgi:hypothetical protein